MEALRLSQSDLARATGLSEKTISNVLSTDNGSKRKTRWALCDALGWTQDSIDRLMAGEEPILVDADATPSNVRRLPNPIDAIAERISAVERTQSEGLEAMTAVFDRLDELSRQLRQLSEKVDRQDQTETPNATGES
jgi:transcriptional regulator with XRE-family HTH domain